MPRLFASITAFVFLLSLGACVTPKSVEAPRVALENVRLLHARGLMQLVRVDLLVSNPNDFDIPLTGLDFNIKVNGAHFANGVLNETVTVPRRGRATVPVEVTISMLAVLRQINAVERQGKLDYRLSGTAFLDHLLLPSIAFDRTGSLSLRTDGGAPRFQALEG